MSAESSAATPALDITTSGEIFSMPILILNVHENCNCKCGMCDIWKRPRGAELSLERITAYQSSIRKLNVQQIVLTGGEPLLHSHFRELCELLKQCNARLTLLSTGLLLRKRATSIADCVDEIIVSLDGPEDIHDAIRGIPRAYQLMHEGIVAVREIRPNLEIRARCTIQSANFRYIRQTVEAARELGCDSISFLAVDTSSQAFNRELVWPTVRRNEIGLVEDEVLLLEKEIELLIEQYEPEVQNRFIVESPGKLRRIVSYFRECLGEQPPHAPTCNAPWVSTVVEVDGTVRPCFFHRSVGNTNLLPLIDAINTTAAKEFRRTLDIDRNPVCQRCVCSLNYRQ